MGHQGLEFSINYFTLGFQLKALATRLKNKQDRDRTGGGLGMWLELDLKGGLKVENHWIVVSGLAAVFGTQCRHK